VIGLKSLGVLGFYKVMFLWGILALGFIYEWANNSLQ
jgi:NADH:ubiquinone oxidoreductase subunit 3 (subunit A)